MYLFSVLSREFLLTGQMSYCATRLLHKKIHRVNSVNSQRLFRLC